MNQNVLIVASESVQTQGTTNRKRLVSGISVEAAPGVLAGTPRREEDPLKTQCISGDRDLAEVIEVQTVGRASVREPHRA